MRGREDAVSAQLLLRPRQSFRGDTFGEGAVRSTSVVLQEPHLLDGLVDRSVGFLYIAAAIIGNNLAGLTRALRPHDGTKTLDPMAVLRRGLGGH